MQLVPNGKKSLWEGTSASQGKVQALSGVRSTEYAIVGAGVAGLSSAMTLAKMGHKALVLEAGKIGSGASGNSGGLIAPDFIKHTPTQIESVYGAELGRQIIDLFGSGGRQLCELIEENGLNCSMLPGGFWTPAHSEDVKKKLADRGEDWRKRGYQVETVSADEIFEQFGSPRYCGGLKFAEGGAINPLVLCLEMARVAVGMGAEIFCNSPVISVEREQGKWALRTNEGFVLAEKVILAANGGNSRLLPVLKNTVIPLHVYEYATKPLSDTQRQKILPCGGAFTDKQKYLFTARLDEDGRLIAAFPQNSFLLTDKGRIVEAQRRLALYFPSLENAEIEYLWRATAWINTSLLPSVSEFDDNIVAIQACNGRGLANNVVLGREVAEWMANVRQDISVPLSQPKPINWYQLARFAPAVLMTMAYAGNTLTEVCSKIAEHFIPSSQKYASDDRKA